MTVQLLQDLPALGLKGEIVTLVIDRASRLIENGKARLEPPDQELSP